MATLEDLRLAFIDLDENRTLAATHDLIARSRATPASILNTCQLALKVVGERYERREYFISGLIMAGELFKQVLDLAQPPVAQAPQEQPAGTIVLGTVESDIHDIGKNLFSTTLRSYGFTVIDLGVDVAPGTFLQEVEASRPHVVCLSGLIMSAFDSMKKTVALVRSRQTELRYRPPIVLGGATVDGRICRYCEADSWSTDAMEGVRICLDLVNKTELL